MATSNIIFPDNHDVRTNTKHSWKSIKPCKLQIYEIQKLLDTQCQQYVDQDKKTDCQAELRKLLKTGPPIYVADKHDFPLEENDTHIVKLWFALVGP